VLITKDRTRSRRCQDDPRARRSQGSAVLVASQIALTVVLLVSSGLLVVSFGNLVRRDVGVRDANQIVTARAPLSGPRYQPPLAQTQFFEQLLARTAALPGVQQAALINEVPGAAEASRRSNRSSVRGRDLSSLARCCGSWAERTSPLSESRSSRARI